jgi:hypothetical protein
MQTLEIQGRLWNDGTNTYNSAEIICDYSLPTEKVFYLPFNYGYENQFIHNSIQLLVDAGELPQGTISERQVKDLGIDVITSFKYCKKREMIQVKKYKISFFGRLSSSIGKVYKIREIVEAVTPDEAVKKLYSLNKYEHISELSFK